VRLLRPLTIAGLLLSACYQQPVISPQRPLRCTPGEMKAQCPKGFTCVAPGVCAANSCQEHDDCPTGLVCSSRGCVTVPDGGAGDAPPIQIPDPFDGSAVPDAGAATPDAAAPSPDLSISTPDGGTG